VVYEAWDRERRHSVALKVLSRISPDTLLNFKREFRLLAEVSHPNLVPLYELFEQSGSWYFTMGLVDGVTFEAWVRPDGVVSLHDAVTRAEDSGAPTQVAAAEPVAIAAAETLAGPPPTAPTVRLAPQFDEQRLRQSLRQLVEALSAIHDVGVVHRDVKPSNVMVTRDGHLVLLDFGLARPLESVSDADRAVSGTPRYMSPEQAMGHALSSASDWYSVGAMLYEALTGRVPHPGPPRVSLLAKCRTPPTPVDELVHPVPADLARLAMDLLAIDPTARPDPQLLLRRLGAAPSPRRSDTSLGPRFVGRREQLGILQDAAVRARSEVVVAVVRGPSGMGKTSLVRRFLEAELPYVSLVLAGRCYEQESVPFKAVDGLIDALCQHLRSVDAAPSTPGPERFQLAALTRIFGVLEGLGAAEVDLPQDDLQVRRQAAQELRAVLHVIGRELPVVLFIDDAQWGDADSAALLRGCLAPPNAPPLLLLATAREDRELPLLEGLGDRVTIELGALDRTSALELARSIGHGADERLAEIVSEAGGSPMLIDELARTDGDLGQGVRLEDVLLIRVGSLDRHGRLLLQLLAVAGQPMKISLIAAILEAAADVDALLAALRGHRLVHRAGPGMVECYHDRVRALVLSRLDRETTSAIHRQIAEALEETDTEEHENLARHWAAAGELAKASSRALSAAHAVSSALAFERAARLFELVLEWGHESQDVLREVRVQLATALANAGRAAEAAAHYAAAAVEETGLERHRLERLAAEKFLVSGNFDRGRTQMRALVEAIGMQFPNSRGAALRSLLFNRARIRVRGLRHTVRPAAEVPAEELLQIDTCWSVAIGLTFVDFIYGADFQMRHLLRALDAGEPYRLALAVALEAGWGATAGHSAAERTDRQLALAAELAERSGVAHARAMVAFNRGLAAFLQGRNADCADHMRRAEAILTSECTDVTFELNNAHLYGIYARWRMGDIRAVCERVPTLVSDAEARSDSYAHKCFSNLSYTVHLQRDDPDTAMQIVTEVEKSWVTDNELIIAFQGLGARTEVNLYCGHGEEAVRDVAAVGTKVTRSPAYTVREVRVALLSMRVRAAIAAAVESPRHLAAARADVRRLDATKEPWGRALAMLYTALIDGVAGDRDAAIARLPGAISALDAVPMYSYAEAARWVHAELTDDAEAAAVQRRWFEAQGCRDPGRMASVSAPGGWFR